MGIVKRGLLAALLIVGGLSAADLVSLAADDDDENPAALAPLLSEATVPLEQGLRVSASEGRPISGKYEIENGSLQLSIYVAKGTGFSELIVDHKTSSIAKAEPITGGDDLKEAQLEGQALAQAKLSLDKAAANAVAANAGYRAVSVVPALANGHPSAEVTLMKGTEIKKVAEKLD